jgi:hypothetical protein
MKIKSLIFTIIVLGLTTNSYGASYAYLFSNNGTMKLNLDTNSITNVTTSVTPSIGYLNVPVFANTSSNSLFIFYGENRIGLAIFNLQNLHLKKNIGIISYNEDGDMPYIIIPPTGNIFYLKWVTANTFSEYTASYNLQTLDKLSDNTNFPISYYKYLGYSTSGDKLFGIDISSGLIDVYDSTTFTQTDNYSIENIFLSTNTGKEVEDFENNILLIAESSALDPSSTSNIDMLYAFNVVGKQLLSKINTGIKGSNMKLTPDGNMILYSETKQTYYDNYHTNSDTGKIHLYSTTTGKEITTVTIPANSYCSILGISPDSSNAYLIVKIPNSEQYELVTLDLNKFQITNIIKNVFATTMVFY